MSIPAHESFGEILEHIQNLQNLAATGDTEAAEYLTRTATLSALMLHALQLKPVGDAGRVAIDAFASKTDVWPVCVPAMEDIRERAIANQLPAAFPGETFYRTEQARRKDTGGKTKPRDTHPETGTGVAKRILIELEQARYWSGIYPTARQFLEMEAGKIAILENEKAARKWAESTIAEGWIYVWEQAKKLPSLTAESVPQYEEAGLSLAEAKCAGKWWDYPSPPVIARAEKIAKTGDRKCKSPRTAIKEFLKEGFPVLARQE